MKVATLHTRWIHVVLILGTLCPMTRADPPDPFSSRTIQHQINQLRNRHSIAIHSVIDMTENPKGWVVPIMVGGISFGLYGYAALQDADLAGRITIAALSLVPGTLITRHLYDLHTNNLQGRYAQLFEQLRKTANAPSPSEIRHRLSKIHPNSKYYVGTDFSSCERAINYFLPRTLTDTAVYVGITAALVAPWAQARHTRMKEKNK